MASHKDEGYSKTPIKEWKAHDAAEIYGGAKMWNTYVSIPLVRII